MEVSATSGVAFLASALVVCCLHRPAIRSGLVDLPSARKRHHGAVPLTGGLAIFLGFMLVVLPQDGLRLALAPLLLCMTAMLLLGLYDDLRDVAALRKLLLQIVIATGLTVASGVEINVLGDLFGLGRMGLGVFSLPFTVLCMVLMVNAVNMADGLDGLAGGAVAIICLLLALVGWLDGAPPKLVACCLILAAATGGFLLFNYRLPVRGRLKAFMGDSGSMMLGLAVAWLAIAIATADSARVYPLTIGWILVIPAADTLSLFVRRLQCGRSPFAPDRTHFHHLLSRLGLSVPATVAVLHGLVLASGLGGILAWRHGVPEPWLFAGLCLILVGGYLAPLLAPGLYRWHRRRRSRRLAGDRVLPPVASS